MIDERFAQLPGTCRDCGSTRYTVQQLNLHAGQDWRCYFCFDRARVPGWNIVKAAR